MTGIQKYHWKVIKLKVVMAALSGEKNLSQLASVYGVHTTQTKKWKAQALEAVGDRFAQRRGKRIYRRHGYMRRLGG